MTKKKEKDTAIAQLVDEFGRLHDTLEPQLKRYNELKKRLGADGNAFYRGELYEVIVKIGEQRRLDTKQLRTVLTKAIIEQFTKKVPVVTVTSSPRKLTDGQVQGKVLEIAGGANG